MKTPSDGVRVRWRSDTMLTDVNLRTICLKRLSWGLMTEEAALVDTDVDAGDRDVALKGLSWGFTSHASSPDIECGIS